MASRWPKRAVIFDMDGVLFDSASIHARAFAETFAPLGIDVDYRTISGRRTDEAVRALLATRQVADEKLVAELTAKKKSLAHRYLKEAPPVVDGCAALLSRWKRRHRLALASSASRPNIELFLDASGARSLFDVVIAGEDVAESKPHPAIYSRAIAALGVAAEEAVVVEDAVAGIRAGHAAGADVVAVAGTHPRAELVAERPAAILDSVSELDRLLARVVDLDSIQLDPFAKSTSGKWTAIVPAAGRGSRLGYDRPKILFPIQGRTILAWLIELIEGACERFVFVVSPTGRDSIAWHLQRLIPGRFDLIVQPEPTGMGDAVLRARDAVTTPNCLVIWGDQVSLRRNTLDRCRIAHEQTANAVLTLPTILRSEPYIHFRRAADGAISAVEQRREGTISVDVGENDCGVFFFRAKPLFDQLRAAREERRARGSVTGEFNLLEIIPHLESDPGIVQTVRISDEEETWGINTPAEAERVAGLLQSRRRAA